MRIVGSTGRDDIARAYIGEMHPGKCVEFCESVDIAVTLVQEIQGS